MSCRFSSACMAQRRRGGHERGAGVTGEGATAKSILRTGRRLVMNARKIAGWGLALGLAGAFVFMVGLPKFMGPAPNPIFALIAGRSGIDFFEPYVRYATGAGELAAAALLVWPASRRLGALLAGAISLGAIGFHLSPWLGIRIPDMGRLSDLLQQGTSVADIDAMGLPTDGGALFATAVAFLLVSIAVFFLSGEQAHRAKQTS